MSEICKDKVVIALGNFDSVHIGHRSVISRANLKAKELGAKLVVFLFESGLRSMLLGTSDKPVYDLKKRQSLIEEIAPVKFHVAPVSKDFLETDRSKFLDSLCIEYDVKCFVSGDDFRFGKNADGNVEYLREYSLKNGIEVLTVEGVNFDDKRVSTTVIKGLLQDGDIKSANRLLGKNYSILGRVEKGRGVGKNLGFPTVNLSIDNSVLSLKCAVYKGCVKIDGKKYKAIINYGDRPTFSLDEKLIEAHVIDSSGDLYGRTIQLEFTDYLREIIEFDDKDQLIKQLKKDVREAKQND